MTPQGQLAQDLGILRDTRTVILGVGNILKGDDGVGPLVCARLADRVSATVIDAGTVPENYLRPVIRAKPEHLLVIDAVDFDGPPGHARLFRPDQVGDFALSTHSLSLHLFLDMLGRDIEVQAHLLGIQPAQTELGQPVSTSVQRSIDCLIDALLQIFPLRSGGSA